jgi:hypothetical protein
MLQRPKSCQHPSTTTANINHSITWGAREKFKIELTRRGFVIKSCHSKILCAEVDEGESIFEGSFTVTLKSAHGFYLSALEEGVLEWNREEVGAWEVFECEVKQGNKVTFKSAHGKYLCAAEDDLVCDRDEVGDWETFELVEGLDGGFRLLTAHGKFVCADGEVAVANREEVGAWETINAKPAEVEE